ncbi:AN1-type zinc finger protein 3-like, partial [Scleropages formosus]
ERAASPSSPSRILPVPGLSHGGHRQRAQQGAQSAAPLSSKTMNLCSKCFADVQKKQPGEHHAAELTRSTSSSQPVAFCNDISSSSSKSQTSEPINSEQMLPEDKEALFLPAQEGGSSTDTAQGTVSVPTKRLSGSASGSNNEVMPGKRARPNDGAAAEECQRGPKQKSRRRCHRCQIKLELVQQELGSCRCGYIFCMLHRLPEQHDCLFDHLGRGREEAVLKMVKLDRKVGRTCQRIGEECS